MNSSAKMLLFHIRDLLDENGLEDASGEANEILNGSYDLLPEFSQSRFIIEEIDDLMDRLELAIDV